MAEELWLQEARTVIDEPGAGFHVDFSIENRRAIQRMLDKGHLALEHAYYEPIGGVIMGQPLFGVGDTTSTDWDTTGASWAADADCPKPLYEPYTNARTSAMSYRATGEPWTLEQKTAFGWGQPFLVQFATYSKTGSQTGDMLTIEFGGVWKLRLRATGKAELDRKDANGIYQPMSAFDWMASQWAPSQHWLWVYQCGAKLVIRNRGEAGDGEPKGLALWDETAEAEPDKPGILHALRAGKVKFSGEGYIAIGCAAQTFDLDDSDPVTSKFRQVSLSDVGIPGEGSTQPVAAYAWGRHTDGATQPTVTVYNELDAEWPQTSAPESAQNSLRYDVEWQTAGDSTFYLLAVDIVVPRTTRSTGTTGTDVIAVSGVADKRLSLHREGDMSREGFSAELLAADGTLASYIQPNMTVRYESGGTNRFRGYSSNATWQTIADADTTVGLLGIEAEGLWSRFRRAIWPGGRPFDGQRLTDCLVRVAEAAGLTDSEYAIVDDPFVIPTQPDGEPPAFTYRPGTTCDRILEELRDGFFGLWLTAYFRVTDGLFVVEYAAPTTGSTTATFYQTSAAASAAGSPGQVILDGSYHETLDQSDMANVVTVIGQDANREPIIARCIDWPSLRTSTVRNFVGEPWHLIVMDPGYTTQEACNWVCRSLFDRHRYPKIYAEWRSIRVDVWPGDLVVLAGDNYNKTYQIKGVQYDRAADGDEADPMGRATYSAERVA